MISDLPLLYHAVYGHFNRSHTNESAMIVLSPAVMVRRRTVVPVIKTRRYRISFAQTELRLG
jgi:hypothetical protein